MRRDPLVPAGFVLGMAFAAFFDGIVLHQILQWHHLICDERTCVPDSIADLQRKDRADGFFHLGAYVTLLWGTLLLFRAGRLRKTEVAPKDVNRSFGGGLLMGFGTFNVVEGIIDHHILQIHHVRFGPDRPVWDVGFLVLSALILCAGIVLLQTQQTNKIKEN